VSCSWGPSVVNVKHMICRSCSSTLSGHTHRCMRFILYTIAVCILHLWAFSLLSVFTAHTAVFPHQRNTIFYSSILQACRIQLYETAHALTKFKLCQCKLRTYYYSSRWVPWFVALSRMATRSSCEPMRTSAYSEDIRWRMVWQREVQGSPWSE